MNQGQLHGVGLQVRVGFCHGKKTVRTSCSHPPANDKNKKHEKSTHTNRSFSIVFKIMFLGCVIGRRGIDYTASSLWPCQKHYLKHYTIHKRLLFTPMVEH